MYLILCPNDMTEKTRETQEIGTMPTAHLDILATNRRGGREVCLVITVQGEKLAGEGVNEKASVGALPKPHLGATEIHKKGRSASS